jgi:hypothetical protein
VEVGELKGRLNEVISNCDALCKRISSLGPEALVTTITPFSPSIAREKEDSNLPENKLEISVCFLATLFIFFSVALLSNYVYDTILKFLRG